jgi:hypothetical protein
MAESPRRVDLRLTIPAAAPYLAVAVELAGRFAEYSGAAADAARTLAQAVEAAIAPVAEAQPDKPIDLEMSAQGRELVVTARAGSTTKRATCPLPD